MAFSCRAGDDRYLLENCRRKSFGEAIEQCRMILPFAIRRFCLVFVRTIALPWFLRRNYIALPDKSPSSRLSGSFARGEPTRQTATVFRTFSSLRALRGLGLLVFSFAFVLKCGNWLTGASNLSILSSSSDLELSLVITCTVRPKAAEVESEDVTVVDVTAVLG